MGLLCDGFPKQSQPDIHHYLMLMAYAINIDDAWGIVNVWNYQSLEDARKVFSSIYEDLRYKSDGTVKAVVLVQGIDAGAGHGLEWFAFRSF